jgi:thioredoxin reductase (NADPH)
MQSESRGSGPELTLYVREYCHLCHEMRDALEPLRVQHGFRLKLVDVDDDPELEERLGEKVPVLAADGRELCHYVLDPAAVGAYLAQIR